MQLASEILTFQDRENASAWRSNISMRTAVATSPFSPVHKPSADHAIMLAPSRLGRCGRLERTGIAAFPPTWCVEEHPGGAQGQALAYVYFEQNHRVVVL
jgi:hypothetical protein